MARSSAPAAAARLAARRHRRRCGRRRARAEPRRGPDRRRARRGRPFRPPFTPPDAIGHRALAVNLSDLAAMGAAPRLALLSLALPPGCRCDDFDGIVAGLTRLAAAPRPRRRRQPDAVARPPRVDVTVAGTVKRRQALTRGGARPGDALYVTGTIGAAAAGLELLQAPGPPSPATSSAACIERYLCPEPRVRCGVLLARNQAATACMDLSDGLADAVRQLAAASGVGALIEAALLPLDPSVEARGERDGTGSADRRLGGLARRRLRAALLGRPAADRPAGGGPAPRRRAAHPHRRLHAGGGGHPPQAPRRAIPLCHYGYNHFA